MPCSLPLYRIVCFSSDDRDPQRPSRTARVAAVIDEIVAAHLLQPIGELWLSTLKITLVPLVFVLVAHGMISLDRTGETGQSSVV
jgi:hypothetical protein